MTQYTILGRLRLMTELDEAGARNALPWCAAALALLLPQLNATADRDDPRLDQAAAATALCLLLQHEGTQEGIAGFKAGDITVTKTDKAGKERRAFAEQLRAQAMDDCKELLRDTGAFAAAKPFGRGRCHE
jgi:hypothetical protein